HPGIRRGEARDEPVEPLRDAGLDDEAGLSALPGIGPVDFEVRRIRAPEQTRRAFVVERPYRGVYLDVVETARVFERGCRGGELRDIPQRNARREDDFD